MSGSPEIHLHVEDLQQILVALAAHSHHEHSRKLLTIISHVADAGHKHIRIDIGHYGDGRPEVATPSVD